MQNRFMHRFAFEASIALSILLAVALLTGISFFEAEPHVLALLEWVDSHEFWGLSAFIVIYMLVVILLLPGMLFTLGAGFLFGIVKGSLLVIVAENRFPSSTTNYFQGAPQRLNPKGRPSRSAPRRPKPLCKRVVAILFGLGLDLIRNGLKSRARLHFALPAA